MSKSPKKAPLETGLLMAMRALDNQIARAVNSRTPQDKSERGLGKWQEHGQRIEHIVGLILEGFGADEVRLDGLIVLSQAYVKALKLITEDLGEDGLGSVRSDYVRQAAIQIEKDLLSIEAILNSKVQML